MKKHGTVSRKYTAHLIVAVLKAVRDWDSEGRSCRWIARELDLPRPMTQQMISLVRAKPNIEGMDIEELNKALGV